MKPCFEKDELEKYLSGWTDDADCSAIEDHLAQCSQCEQTVTQLESETNTGLAKLVSLASSRSSPSETETAQVAEPDSNNGMAAALDSVRNWNGSPPAELAASALAASALATPGLGMTALGNSSLQQTPALSSESSKGAIGNFGHYEICELIGRGGMAEVYRARHKRLDRDVAIKLLRVPQSQIRESLNRIEREIRAVGRLTLFNRDAKQN